jgi:hypothetical protein
MRTLFEEIVMDQNYTFMFYGFLAAWLVVIIYVISIALRERKLRAELDRVKRMVDDREHEAKP